MDAALRRRVKVYGQELGMTESQTVRFLLEVALGVSPAVHRAVVAALQTSDAPSTAWAELEDVLHRMLTDQAYVASRKQIVWGIHAQLREALNQVSNEIADLIGREMSAAFHHATETGEVPPGPPPLSSSRRRGSRGGRKR
jgi:hypothetical protein